MLYKRKMNYLAAALGLCLLLSGCGGDRITLTGAETDAMETAGEPSETEGEPAGTAPAAGTQLSSGNGTGSAGSAGRIAVHICGEVKNPGVYELPEGSRLEAALEAAGGFTQDAEEASINLAAAAQDGSQIVVRAVGEQEPAGRSAVDEDGVVDLNRAAKEELCTLPGIGESRAEAILAYREEHGAFQKPEDLMRVSGIKEGSYAKLKDKIKVN